jgi:plastocyanin/uncharacterized protein YjdB
MAHVSFATHAQRLFGSSWIAPGRGRRRSCVGVPLRLESLEERALLATTTVDVVNFAFNPTPVTIHVGDTIHWVWQTDNHSTTSVQGSLETWDSGIHNTGFTFDHTFQQVGTYIYYCRVHGIDNHNGTASNMAGEIDVVAAPPSLQSIAVTPANPTIAKGLTEQFTATGTFSDGSMQNLTNQVTWASATQTTATVTQAGLATGVGQGTSTISATKNGVSGSTTLTVNPAVLQSIAVTPANPTIAKGLTEQFTATGNLSDGSTENLTNQAAWASATQSTATITQSGVATGVGQGTSLISASFSGKTGSTTLTVNSASVQSIAVTPANPTILKGHTEAFTATGTLTDASTQDLTSQVTWASATQSTATITPAGVATGVAQGTSTISATLGNVSGSTTLTVTLPTLESIAVTPAGPSIAKGLTQQFSAMGTFSDNSTQDLTGSVLWASATSTVATITQAGVATGVAQGTSVISASMNGVSGSTTLTVTAPVLQSITVNPAGMTIAAGQTQTYTATGTLTDGSTEDLTSQVTWASSNPQFAAITPAGVATGVAQGTSTISATLNGITGSTSLAVNPAMLLSIAVMPSDPSIPAGETEPFTASGTFSDHSTKDVTSQVVWTSAAHSVAIIINTGIATGVAQGTSTISASLSGVTDSTTLTVTAAVLQAIAVAPANPTIAQGQTEPFTATGTLSDHSTEDLTSQVNWASATMTTATITSSGVATAVAPGTSVISASMSGLTASTTLTVTPPVLVSIAVTPADPTIAAGLTESFTATGTLSDQSTEDLTTAVTWASSSASTASVTQAGVATSLAVGSTTISATSGNISGSTMLTIGPAVLVSLAVSPLNPSTNIGVPEQFKATGTFSDSSTEDLTATVTWASATASVATITQAGIATGLAAGTSKLSATSGAIAGNTTLTVNNVTLQSIVVTPSNPNLPKGETETFAATGMFSDGSTEDLTSAVTWASATSSVATITPAGVSTGVAGGQSTISATLGNMSGTTLLTVGPAVLQSIAVTPANPSLPKGETEPFTATGTFSDNSTQDLTSQVTWASASSQTATISNTGVASGVATGSVTISATLDNVTGKTGLTVGPAALLSIVVTPASASVSAGGTESLTATGKYSDSSTQDLTSQVTWASASPAIATISTNGVATGVAAGTTTATATLAGVSGKAGLTVTPSPTPTPPPPPMLANEQRIFSGKGPRRKLVAFQVGFSTALSVASASNIGNYNVVQPGATKRAHPTVVKVKSALYSAATNSVMLTLGKFNAKKPLTLTASGLIGATGTPAATIVTKL